MRIHLTPFDAVLLAGAALLGVLLLGPVLTIPLQIPINYNEGWNAGFDSRAVSPGAGPLYPGADSLVFNNYPPLGFFIVGAAGRFVFGDMIIAGRVVALVALLATAGLVGLCVRQLGGSLRAGAAAALLLLLLVSTFSRSYVAMDDPQWLAHALQLASLALLLRGGATHRLRAGTLPFRQIVAAALLMVMGGFVKHNLVALPLALTLWLAWLNPRAAAIWLVAAGTAAGAGLGLMAALFGHVAFFDILQHRRVFRLHLLTNAIGGVAPLLPMAAVTAAWLRRRWSGDGARLATLFACIALPTGVAQRIGEGVNYNAHFETIVALCIGFGLALTSLPGVTRRRGLPGPASLCVFAALPVLGAMPWHLPAAWHDVTRRAARQAAWQPMIQYLAASAGPVGCETQSLCYWAGKPFRLDVFNLTQHMMTAPVRALTPEGAFTLLEYEPGTATHHDAIRRLGYDPIIRAFGPAYVRVARGPKGAVLLAPGTQAAAR